MCGRYVSPDQAAIERAWGVHARDIPPFAQNFNVVPTSTVPLLQPGSVPGEFELVTARWGFIPHWWKQEKPPRLTHNARSEEAANKPMWREPLSRRRCLIPAIGWYEWKAVERTDEDTGEIKRAKQPYFIHLPDNALFCFAGLMSYLSASDADEEQITCSILTQNASESVADVHERMPVVLPNDAHANWLSRDLLNGVEAIRFASEKAVLEFEHYAVSDLINRPIVSDATLIAPA